MPHWLRLRDPSRDTVLYPAISYPSYAMGAELAGARAVPVPITADGRSDLDAIDPADAARALCLWVNSPANPSGHLDDLGAAAEWGRAHGVPVLFSSHQLELVERLCDDLVIIANGAVAASGDREALRARHGTPRFELVVVFA